MEEKVNIGLSKSDPGTLIAFIENKPYPFVSLKIEIKEIDNFYIPVGVFTSAIDDEENEEIQRRITDRLKLSVINNFKIPLRWQIETAGEICALVVKDGKNLIIPLPVQPKTEENNIIVPKI